MDWLTIVYVVAGLLSAVEYITSEARAYGRLTLSMLIVGAITVLLWPLYWFIGAFLLADRITLWRAK